LEIKFNSKAAETNRLIDDNKKLFAASKPAKARRCGDKEGDALRARHTSQQDPSRRVQSEINLPRAEFGFSEAKLLLGSGGGGGGIFCSFLGWKFKLQSRIAAIGGKKEQRG
jgi:hypothetical protein